MAYARGRTIASWGRLFGPWAVDSGSSSPDVNAVRLTQLVVAVIQRRVATTAVVEEPDGDGTVDAGINPTDGDGLCGEEAPVAKDEIEYDGGVLRYAKVPINIGDEPTDPRVASFGPIRRSLSDDFAQVRGTTVSATLIDTDGTLRAAEDSDSLIGCRYSRYVSSERRLRLDPTDWRRVFDGIITDTEPQAGRLFGVTVTDYLSRILDQFGKKTYPQRVFNLADHPNLGNPADDPVSPGNPTLLGKPVPIGYGFLSDEGTTRAGVVPFVHVGRRAFASRGGVLMDEFVAFGHAAGWWGSLFVPEGPGLSTGTSFPSRIPVVPSSGLAEYEWPGTPGWIAEFGSQNYVDYNGNRYTSVFGLPSPRVDLNRSGQVPLVANFGGIEDVGDGTGAVIAQLRLQIVHLLTNWILQSYASGAWLTIPTVGAGADLYSRIDTDTFNTLEAFGGAFLLGAGSRAWSIDELMATAAKNLHCQFGVNRHGQIIGSLNNPADAINRRITAVAEVLTGSYTGKRRRDLVRNTVTYRLGRRYSPPLAGGTPAEGEILPVQNTQQNTEWEVEVKGDDALRDSASVTRYGERIEDIDFEFVRDADAAALVAQLVLDECAVPPIIATHTEGPCGTETDLGDVDTVTHFDALSETARRQRCEVHSLDCDQWTVTKDYRERAAS